MKTKTRKTSKAKKAEYKANSEAKVKEAADLIVGAFQNPETLPKALAPIFIKRNDNIPCRQWSWNNQLLTALHGHSDARGFRQWQEVGRQVQLGQKSFAILSPCVRTREDKATGEKVSYVSGFRTTAVFGYSQTEGADLPEPDPTLQDFLKNLPFRAVADSWNLTVEAYSGREGAALGKYRLGTAIVLGVKNLSVFAHELIHAADDRNVAGGLKGGQHADQEIVAQLGAAILLTVIGEESEADLGFSWRYIQAYAQKNDVETIQVCQSLLKRTCEAVATILDTAEAIAKETTPEASDAPESNTEADSETQEITEGKVEGCLF